MIPVTAMAQDEQLYQSYLGGCESALHERMEQALRMGDLYFSQSLRAKLALLNTAPLTAVEAQAEYRNAMAIRSALDGLDPSHVHWYTAIERSQDGSFLCLCRQLERVDPSVAGQLRELGF